MTNINKIKYRKYILECMQKSIRGACGYWNPINGLDEIKAIKAYRAQLHFLLAGKNKKYHKILGFWNCSLKRRLELFKHKNYWNGRSYES